MFEKDFNEFNAYGLAKTTKITLLFREISWSQTNSLFVNL